MSNSDGTEARRRASRTYEIEVPGTPEEVWQAIATGPGIAAWFVPAEVEEREGGVTRLEIMPGVEQEGVVSAWQPPAPRTAAT